MDSKQMSAKTPPSTLSKSYILIETPSGRAYRDFSPAGDTQAETPSSAFSNSSDDESKFKLENDDSPDSNSVVKINEVDSRNTTACGLGSCEREPELEKPITPHNTTSTARMMIFGAIMKNFPSPPYRENASTPIPENINGEEEDTVTPTKNNRSIQSHSGEKSLLKPNSLFPEVELSIDSSPPSNIVREHEPVHLTPQKKRYSLQHDAKSVFDDSLSDCPFDCVEEYKVESSRMYSSPFAIEVSTTTREISVPETATIPQAEKLTIIQTLKSSYKWVLGYEKCRKRNSSQGSTTHCVNLAINSHCSRDHSTLASRFASNENCFDTEIGNGNDNYNGKDYGEDYDEDREKYNHDNNNNNIKSSEQFPTDVIKYGSSIHDDFESCCSEYGEGVERELFPEAKSSQEEQIRKKWSTGVIVFYFAVAICVVVIILFSVMLISQRASHASGTALSDSSAVDFKNDPTLRDEGYFDDGKTLGTTPSIESESNSEPSRPDLPNLPILPGLEPEPEPEPEPEMEMEMETETGPMPEPEPETLDFVLVNNNQVCSDSVALGQFDIVYRGTTADSFWDDTSITCGDSLSIGYAAWFSFQSERDIIVEVSTCGRTDFATQITILSGECDQLRCEVFNDQPCGDQSQVLWFAERQKLYYILVNGYRDNKGVYNLTLKTASNHGTCDRAMSYVELDTKHFGTVADAIEHDTPQCGDVDVSRPGVWYSTNQNLSGLVRAEVLGRGRNGSNQISVYSGNECNAIRCQTGSRDGGVSWRATSGEKYFIFVSSLTNDAGGFDLYFANDWEDECYKAARYPLGASALVVPSTQMRPHQVPSCDRIGLLNAPGVWISIIGTGGVLTASTNIEGTALATEILVYEGDCDSLRCADSSYQNLAHGDDGTISWLSEIAKEYRVFVSSNSTRTGDAWLQMKEVEMPGGSVCISPLGIVLSSETTGTTENSYRALNSCGDFNSSVGVWYEFEGTGHDVTASACSISTNFEARVSLFSGSCGGLQCMGHTSGVCGDHSFIKWNAAYNTTYYLFVHGVDEMSKGEYQLRIEDVEANASCDGAILIEARTHSYFGSNLNVGLSERIKCERRRQPTYGVWYMFVGSGTQVTISTCSELTEFDTEISIFSGSCSDLTCVDVSEEGCGNQAAITMETEEGENYHVLIRGSDESEAGNFVMGVSVADSQFGW